MTRKKCWSRTVGGYGYRVRVIARGAHGRLTLRWWDPGKQGYVDRALGHADRDQAEVEAKEVSAALLTATQATSRGIVTVAELFSRYEREVLPKRKTEAGRQEARRRITLWQIVLGATTDVDQVDESDLDRFVADRTAGRIRMKEHELAKAPGPRAIGADLEFLRAVFNWGRRLKGADGKRLVTDNPVLGYAIPKAAAPRRPVATYDRFLAIRAHCEAVDPQRLFGAFMDLVEALGWRESALCQLWASDYDRRRVPKVQPYGRIRKRWATDKEGVEMWVPLSKGARQALELVLRRNSVVGDVPLFPAPRAKGKTWSRWHARQLLHRAEARAEVPELAGGDFHPYRRKWVTERKHLAKADVAAAGGWKTERTLELYAQSDPATMLAVVTEPTKLRDVRQTRARTGASR